MVRGSTVDTTKMPKNNCDIDLLIHNKFEIEVINAETGEVKQKAEGYNIIKDALWNYLFARSGHQAWFNAIAFGSGSGTPSADTMGLFQMVGCKTASGNTFKTVPEEGYAYHRRSIQLGVSEYVGSTITEVGIHVSGSTDQSGVMTHAMLQDMNGNQISITKTDTDIITIYATVYVHWNPAGYEDGKIKISCSLETNVNDGQLITELLGYLGGTADRSIWFYSGPMSSLSVASASGSLVKDLTTKTYTLTYGRLGVDAGNVSSGILSAYSMNVYLQGPCSGLPGTDVKAESIATGDGVTTEYNTKFPFPQNAEIFVDGVLTTDVVVNGDNPGKLLPFTTAFKFLPEHSTLSRRYLSVPMGIYHYDLHDMLWGSNGVAVYENTWANLGVNTILRAYSLTIEVSDDLENWHPLTNTATGSNWPEFPVPEEYQYYRYWRFTNPYTPSSSSGYGNWERKCISVRTNTPTVNNIIFATPPAEGAVITANYYTPVVAKDSDHVFDMSITIHLGEYTE